MSRAFYVSTALCPCETKIHTADAEDMGSDGLTDRN